MDKSKRKNKDQQEWLRHAMIGTLTNTVNKDNVDKQLIDKLTNDTQMAAKLMEEQTNMQIHSYKRKLDELYEEECSCDNNGYECKTCRRIDMYEEKLDKLIN